MCSKNAVRHTRYSHLRDTELLGLVELMSFSTESELELELSNRLSAALDRIEEFEVEVAKLTSQVALLDTVAA